MFFPSWSYARERYVSFSNTGRKTNCDIGKCKSLDNTAPVCLNQLIHQAYAMSFMLFPMRVRHNSVENNNATR